MIKDNSEFSGNKILLHADKISDWIYGGKDVMPVVWEINLTNRCNLACIFCSEMNYRGQFPDVEVDADKFLDSVRVMKKHGVRAVVLVGGGEPTIHRQFSKIAFGVKEIGIEVGLITNGLTLYRIIEEVKDFSWVRVSLDAGTAETFAKLKCRDQKKKIFFDDVIDGIKAFAKVKGNTTLGVSFIVSEESQHEIELSTLISKDAGADYIQIKPISNSKSKFEFYTSLEHLMHIKQKYECDGFNVFISRFGVGITDRGFKDYPSCYAHRFVGAMSASGDILPCCNLKNHLKDASDFVFGNIHEQALEDIWFGDKRKAIVKEMERDGFVPETCGQCRMDDCNKIMEFIKNPNVLHENFL